MTWECFSPSSLIRSIGSLGDLGGAGLLTALTMSLAVGSFGVGGCSARRARIGRAVKTVRTSVDCQQRDMGRDLREGMKQASPAGTSRRGTELTRGVGRQP